MQLTQSAFPVVALHRVPDNAPAHILAAVALPQVHDASANSEIGLTSDAAGNHSDLESTLLHADERSLANQLSPSKRAAFVAGRVALRAAANAVQPHIAQKSMLRNARGAPVLPLGLAASVSHKRHVAVALASNTQDPRITLGVDIEDVPQPKDLSRPDIGRRILTAREHANIASLEPMQYRLATVVRFALKEAVYKAIDPRVQRYVSFTEVELDVDENGSALATLLLPDVQPTQFDVRAAWWTIGAHILAAVAITDLR